LQTSTGYGFYDCLILASALQCGATTVLSEDLQHNQLIDGTLRIVNPFLNLAMQAG
jgi:predicted nucleic acid-binding protein